MGGGGGGSSHGSGGHGGGGGAGGIAGQLVGSLLSGGKPAKQSHGQQSGSHGQAGLVGMATSFLGGQHGHGGGHGGSVKFRTLPLYPITNITSGPG